MQLENVTRAAIMAYIGLNYKKLKYIMTGVLSGYNVIDETVPQQPDHFW